MMDRALPSLGWRVVVGLARGSRFHKPDLFLASHKLSHTILLDARTGTAYARQAAVARALDELRPDVVVPTTLFDPFPAAARAKERIGNLRLAYVAHETSAQMLLDVALFEGTIDLAVGVSPFLKEALIEICGLPRDRVDHIPYGVEMPRRDRTPARGDTLRLGYVGRLDPDKAPLDLVALCGALDRRCLPFRLTIAGAGSLGDELRRQLGPWLDRGTVRLAGALSKDQLYEEVYPDLDASLLLSRQEGLPIAPMEAMMHGVVPVVSDFRGRAQAGVIRHGETGLVFAPGDMDAAADELQRLSCNQSFLHTLSVGAREEALAKCAISSMAEAWAASLERVCATPARRGLLPAQQVTRHGRLDRFLPPSGAEWLRGILRRRYPHPDPSEWPYAGPWPAGDLKAADERLRSMEENWWR